MNKARYFCDSGSDSTTGNPPAEFEFLRLRRKEKKRRKKKSIKPKQEQHRPEICDQTMRKTEINDCTISICFLSLNPNCFLQKVQSCSLLRGEKKKQSCFFVFFVLFSSFQLCSALHCDYGFYQFVSVAWKCPSDVRCLLPLM